MANSTTHAGKRPAAGQIEPELLPASHDRSRDLFIPLAPTREFVSWTFCRGTVIWRLWPAVLLHTVFAALVVSLSMKTSFQLKVPPVLLTVLGVVIGFVISYRAMSGYDRYWMGRSCWSDVVKNARGISRIIWFHVPPRLTPRSAEEIMNGISNPRSSEEMMKVMVEKRMALDLVEGFVVATKHHLRGEMDVYYTDLYHLVRPLHREIHQHPHDAIGSHDDLHPAAPKVHHTVEDPSLAGSVSRRHRHHPQPEGTTNALLPELPFTPGDTPSINDELRLSQQSDALRTSICSTPACEGMPLLPGQVKVEDTGLFSTISRDLIPFESFFHWIHTLFQPEPKIELPMEQENGDPTGAERDSSQMKRRRREKHRPWVAGGGQNLPLDILRCISEWASILDDRGTMSGNTNAALFTYIAGFEDNLSALERILTTPLPFVYSAHISTVWIYLFFLPFQLIDQFGWSAIPGVGIASFIYLGFIAAGEEIEQPFGYDENDLDLDLFCQQIVHADIDQLKGLPCHNSYFTSHHLRPKKSIAESSDKLLKDMAGQGVFGTLGGARI